MWVDETGQLLVTPLEYSDTMTGGGFAVTLYSQADRPWLPEGAYLVESVGTIPRINDKDIERRVSCVVDMLEAVPIPAALSILDYADTEDELIQFASADWTVDGIDMNDLSLFKRTGLPGIAIANTGDEPLRQLGDRVSQVTGADEDGNNFVGADAILEDPTLPKDLDAYAEYFEKIAYDVSGMGNIPKDKMGTFKHPQVLYANLSKGPIRLLPQPSGYGVLVLDGEGDFKFDVSMEGKAEWNGIIICARNSDINLYGGGHTASHVYGALLVAHGKVTMNGTADIVYSSKNVRNVNAKLLLYQVYSWCDGWGMPLGSDEYNPVTDERIHIGY